MTMLRFLSSQRNLLKASALRDTSCANSASGLHGAGRWIPPGEDVVIGGSQISRG